MISHELKCIFVHIPRIAGTSIEKALVNKNWWSIDRSTKHIFASQAKEIYKEYWDDYFKFSFVRNPYDRCVSLLKFAEFYYGVKDSSKLTSKHLEGYKNLFGYPISTEVDYRFYKLEDIKSAKHLPNQVYGNYLDEELDFVGKFENLEHDFRVVCEQLGTKNSSLPKVASFGSRVKEYQGYYSQETKELVESLYKNDIEKYDYEF
jgi:hypothetical protein